MSIDLPTNLSPAPPELSSTLAVERSNFNNSANKEQVKLKAEQAKFLFPSHIPFFPTSFALKNSISSISSLGIVAIPYFLVMEKTRKIIENGAIHASPEQKLINGFSSGFIAGASVYPLHQIVTSTNSLSKDELWHAVSHSFSKNNMQKFALRGGLIALAAECITFYISNSNKP